MKSFLLSIVASVFVAVVYGLVVAQREGAIREYLRTSARGVLRWLYVRALLGAVRGDAVVADSRNIAVILCSIFLFASIGASFEASSIRERFASTEAGIRRIDKSSGVMPAKTDDQIRAEFESLKV